MLEHVVVAKREPVPVEYEEAGLSGAAALGALRHEI